MTLKLVIGNKNYSSWSMRPWLAMRASGIAFDEILVPLYTGEPDKRRILDFTGSGKVPALIDGDLTVWDSLSIIEYVAEQFPESRLWPEDRASRAHARSISAEMHSGFMALRNECGMNLHRPVRAYRAVGRCARQRRAHPADMGRVRRALRQTRAVPVRQVLRRGCDVCAGGAPLAHLCDCGRACNAGLYGNDDGVAGLPGMDARGPRRNLCHRATGERLNGWRNRKRGFRRCLDHHRAQFKFTFEQFAERIRRPCVVSAAGCFSGVLSCDRQTIFRASGGDASQVR